MKKKVLLSALFVLFFFFVGCRSPQEVKPDYSRPLQPGQWGLRKITDPLEIPDFTMACLDLGKLQEGVGNSINYLKKPSSRNYFPMGEITHTRALESLKAFEKMLESGLMGTELNRAIRENFDVYISVGWDNKGTVLFTGYYTPIFDGSMERTKKFSYPLYKRPEDLVKGPNGETLGRKTSQGLRPYPPRSVIENSGMLGGNELIWLSDPFEAYIAHVQGSAKIRLADGKLTTIGYSANNGHEYLSIVKQMIADGVIGRAQLSLSAMIDFFKRSPEQVGRYTRLNPRYVFFRLAEGSPRGSLNEPVITLRSIATDKSIFPRASLTFISTKLPRETGGAISTQHYSGFALDQDAGGAIRAPGRCDVYMGVGDLSGKLAGRTYQEGKLYYLFIKPTLPKPGS